MGTVSERNLKRFECAVKALNSVISDCKKENSKCFAYLDGNNNFCLLDGSAGIGEDGDQESIIAISQLKAMGGDW